jgi:hypothetical protein
LCISDTGVSRLKLMIRDALVGEIPLFPTLPLNRSITKSLENLFNTTVNEQMQVVRIHDYL